MEKPLSTQDIEDIRLKGEKHCSCWKSKEGEGKCKLGEPEMYDHSDGVMLEGHKDPQWLYFTCKVCDYQWAWHKILGKE